MYHPLSAASEASAQHLIHDGGEFPTSSIPSPAVAAFSFHAHDQLPLDPSLAFSHLPAEHAFQQPSLSPQPLAGTLTTLPHYHQSQMGGFFVMPEPSQSHNAGKAPRRRRTGNGVDAVKHRRTRSGCFTCRTRRVKCDETHPICERCQKGNRECTYPEVVTNSKSTPGQKRREKPPAAAEGQGQGHGHGHGHAREGSSSLEDVEEEEEMDDYEDGPSPPESRPRLKSSASESHLKLRHQRESWHSSEQGRRSKSRKTISSADGSSPHAHISTAPNSPAGGTLRRSLSEQSLVNSSSWANLPHEVAFYLNFHRQMLTHHHYLLKSDSEDFFKVKLLEHALKSEALLYAVAAFASFHYSVYHTTGAFQTFLEYYNRSVSLLRVSLDEEPTIETVITILQLASFEEYLGDWASLMEHRNGASKIIHQVWNPTTMAATSELRVVFNWFGHFDLIAAMMAGHKATVTAEWQDKNREAVIRQLRGNPDSLVLKLERSMCQLRDLALQISMMTAGRAQGTLSIEEFGIFSQEMLQKLHDWYKALDPDIVRGAETLQAEEGCPFKAAPLYRNERWTVNFLLLDYYGLVIVLNHQIALTNGGPQSQDPSLADYAIKIAEILAAFEAYPETKPGTLLAAQAPIGLAAMWLPNGPNYWHWMQQQLAKIEKMGFVYPLAFRTKISELWGNPQLKHTWVGDSETAISMTIRQLVDARDADFPKDPARKDIKEMRTLMTMMKLDSKGSGIFPPTPDMTVVPSPHSQYSSPDVEMEQAPWGA